MPVSLAKVQLFRALRQGALPSETPHRREPAMGNPALTALLDCRPQDLEFIGGGGGGACESALGFFSGSVRRSNSGV